MECRGWENKNPINRRKRQMNLHELALLIGKDKCTFPSIFQAIHVIGRGLTDTTLSLSWVQKLESASKRSVEVPVLGR